MSKKRARSAKTGRFVKIVYALKHPATTVLERIWRFLVPQAGKHK